MADQYIQQLSATASVLAAYLIPISDDPSGTSRLKKATFTQIVNFLSDNAFSSIGIGITPAAKLHVIGTTEQLRVGYDSSNYISHTIGSSGAYTVTSTGSGGAITFTPTSANNFNITLGSTGRVGITDGATLYARADGEILQIKRNVTNSVSANRTTVGIGNNSNAYYLAYGGATDSFSILDGGFVERLTISSGKVGIGTSSPASLFTVNQAANSTDGTQATYGIRLDNQTVCNFTVGSDASYVYLQSWASKPIVLNSQGNNTILNPTSGSVGIANSSPNTSFKLDVGGYGRFQISQKGVELQGGTTCYVAAYDRTNSVYLPLEIDATTIYLMSTNKLVGVGTSSPSAALHVIKTSEQLRVGYDTSNYYSTTVSSAGAITFDAVGASAGFTFSDALSCSSSILSSSASGGVGYKTGAGGAVTQTTSKSTSVTLNTMCGQITTHTETIAAGNYAIFYVYNSNVTAQDVVCINTVSGHQTLTTAHVFSVGSGSFRIKISNGAVFDGESGAIVISFAIIKAVTS